MSSTVITNHRPANGSFANLLDRLTGLSNEDVRHQEERAVNGINGDLYADDDPLSTKDTGQQRQTSRPLSSAKELRSRPDSLTGGASQLSYERAMQLHSRNQPASRPGPIASSQKSQANQASARQVSEETILRQVRTLAQSQNQAQIGTTTGNGTRNQAMDQAASSLISGKQLSSAQVSAGRTQRTTAATTQPEQTRGNPRSAKTSAAPTTFTKKSVLGSASRTSKVTQQSRTTERARTTARAQSKATLKAASAGPRRAAHAARQPIEKLPPPESRHRSRQVFEPAKSMSQHRAQSRGRELEQGRGLARQKTDTRSASPSGGKRAAAAWQQDPAPTRRSVAATKPSQSSVSGNGRTASRQPKVGLASPTVASSGRAVAAAPTLRSDPAEVLGRRRRNDGPVPGQWRPTRTDHPPRFYETQQAQNARSDIQPGSTRRAADRRVESTPVQRRTTSAHVATGHPRSARPGSIYPELRHAQEAEPYESDGFDNEGYDDEMDEDRALIGGPYAGDDGGAQLSNSQLTDLIGQLKAASHPDGFENHKDRHGEVEQRSSTISVRLNENEFSRLRNRAAESGISISAYMRSCVLEAEQLRAEVKQALAQMRAATRAGQAADLDDDTTQGSTPKDPWPNRLKQLAGLLMTPLFLTRHKA